MDKILVRNGLVITTLKNFSSEVLSIVLGIFLLYVGLLHFIDSQWFVPIVPDILPGSPKFWVYLTGILELVCGSGFFIRKSRKIAGRTTSILLIVLYWANINMWINDIPMNGIILSNTGHVLRALAQIGMIIVAAYIGKCIPKPLLPRFIG